MSFSRFLCSGLLVAAACSAPERTAQEWPDAPPHLIAPSTEEPASHSKHAYEEHFERAAGHHFVNMFLGAVANRRGENGETIGLDYEYRITEEFGAGAYLDWSLGTLRTVVTGVAGYWHPIPRLALMTGPGIEIPVEGGDKDFVWRTGGFYEFVAGEITVAPALFIDYVEGGDWTVVVGLNFGKRW